MPEVELDTRLRTWGNSYGVLIPADVARRLQIQPGESLHVRLSYTPQGNCAANLPTWDLAPDYDIDAILDEELGDAGL